MNNHIEKFNRDLKQRIENEENNVKNKFSDFFTDNFNEISEVSKSKEEFEMLYKNKMETKNELNKHYDKYKDYYEILL